MALVNLKNTGRDRLSKRHRAAGFTVVELIISIAVVAILVLLVIVSYNGIQTKAADSATQSDLVSAGKQLEFDFMKGRTYPVGGGGDLALLNRSKGTTYQYTSDGKSFSLTGKSTRNGTNYFCITSQTNSVKEGPCEEAPGGSEGGGGGDEIVDGTPIQDITSAQCAALPVYTGSNTSAVRIVTDIRGSVTRDYDIAKLADGNCWMITNLKLGSTGPSITLTPSNSDVTSNFELPILRSAGNMSNDNPAVYGPLPGDGSGPNDYGYLYNWPAATAGETLSSKPAGSGNAAHSICPANWRLPTGGNAGDFAMLNAKMNNPSASSPSTSSGSGFYQNWQYTGPFKGVLAGHMWAGYGGQGAWGYYWTSTAGPTGSVYGYDMYFGPTIVRPGWTESRDYGLSIRCVLR